jgi:hypothetical protein
MSVCVPFFIKPGLHRGPLFSSSEEGKKDRINSSLRGSYGKYESSVISPGPESGHIKSGVGRLK